MKVLINIDEMNNITTDDGVNHGTFIGVPIEHKEKSIILDLVKQGVSPDELVKLKNNDLI